MIPVPDARLRCARCNGVVDPRGVDATLYCLCSCKWPVHVTPSGRETRGCGVRIYFLINANEKVQPFNLEDGRAHHASCKVWRLIDSPETTCPSCLMPRPRGAACPRCGWVPPTAAPAPPKGVRPLEGFP